MFSYQTEEIEARLDSDKFCPRLSVLNFDRMEGRQAEVRVEAEFCCSRFMSPSSPCPACRSDPLDNGEPSIKSLNEQNKQFKCKNAETKCEMANVSKSHSSVTNSCARSRICDQHRPAYCSPYTASSSCHNQICCMDYVVLLKTEGGRTLRDFGQVQRDSAYF